jgi:hypothetical protein
MKFELEVCEVCLKKVKNGEEMFTLNLKGESGPYDFAGEQLLAMCKGCAKKYKKQFVKLKKPKVEWKIK